MSRVAVVLAGCGCIDGSDVVESTLVLYHIDRLGLEPVVFAPNMPQSHVANHLTEENKVEVRNVLVESARIVRGDAFDIRRMNFRMLDALVIPGGFGVLKHLSSFAFAGIDCGIITPLRDAVEGLHDNGKPLGFIGASVVLAARIFEGSGMRLAVGGEDSFEYVVSELGCQPVDVACDEIVVDEENGVVSMVGFIGGCSIRSVGGALSRMMEYLRG